MPPLLFQLKQLPLLPKREYAWQVSWGNILLSQCALDLIAFSLPATKVAFYKCMSLLYSDL